MLKSNAMISHPWKQISMAILVAVSLPMITMAQLTYPESKRGEQVDEYHGTKVADPYRWLEDDNSDETKAWVKEQQAFTRNYLDAIPFRDQVRKRLEVMWNYERTGAPFKEGNHYYFYKNNGLQNQSVLFRQIGLNGKPEVFMDPNTLSADGTIAPGVPSFSKTAKYCAYQQAQSGSDWQEVFVKDVATGKLLADKLSWVKFSGISWKGDEGFFYSRYPEPDEKAKLSGKNEFHSIYYHKVGTKQEQDVLIFVDKEHPLRNVYASITEDNRFLVLSVSEGTSGDEIWYKDFSTHPQVNAEGLTKLIPGFAQEVSLIDNDGDQLLFRLNVDAPNYRVVAIDPKKADKGYWKDVIPTRSKMLQSVSSVGGKLIVTYLEDAASRVYQCSMKGVLEREIALPGIGTASGFGGKKEDKEVFYTYTSFNRPSTVYRYDLVSGKSTLYKKPDVKIDPDQYTTVQSFFKSADGTPVPMFITYKKGLQLNGNNPVLIYGYGGFNIPITPSFSISNAYFLEQGGVYVVVSLRGGNEYGEDWHKAGMLENKQNVFNDLIGAAQFLIDTKYTNPKKIAIRGGSNGGLLVGACMTQRPDLFQVAIPEVGVLDMLRYHLFTIGWAWATEYGRSDDAKMFKVLYAYSPLHRLTKGTRYPSTLITTADHDDRVVPAHSFKFAAELQHCHAGDNPVLIRIESKAGHGAGTPTSKQIEQAADVWSFVMQQLGMQPK